jgi:hypothetical protein
MSNSEIPGCKVCGGLSPGHHPNCPMLTGVPQPEMSQWNPQNAISVPTPPPLPPSQMPIMSDPRNAQNTMSNPWYPGRMDTDPRLDGNYYPAREQPGESMSTDKPKKEGVFSKDASFKKIAAYILKRYDKAFKALSKL